MAVVAQLQLIQRTLSERWPAMEQRIRQAAKRLVDRDLGKLESQIAEIERLPKDQLLDRIGDLNKLYRSHKVKLDDGITVLVIGFGFSMGTSMLAGLASFAWSRARGSPLTEEALHKHLETAQRTVRDASESFELARMRELHRIQQSEITQQIQDVDKHLYSIERNLRHEQQSLVTWMQQSQEEQYKLKVGMICGAAALFGINMFISTLWHLRRS